MYAVLSHSNNNPPVYRSESHRVVFLLISLTCPIFMRLIVTNLGQDKIVALLLEPQKEGQLANVWSLTS